MVSVCVLVGRPAFDGLRLSGSPPCVSYIGGAENDGHEIAGHENDGPSSRA